MAPLSPSFEYQKIITAVYKSEEFKYDVDQTIAYNDDLLQVCSAGRPAGDRAVEA